MDLAGARVLADVEDDGYNLVTSLRRYLSDYHHNRNKLLLADGFGSVSPYKKTVWTVWETSLSSLRKAEDGRSGIYPVQLISFMTLLDRANVQDELFRLASPELKEVCHRLNISVPAWMQSLLASGDDNKWNDFSYRGTKKALLRYSLIRQVGEPWGGITMHSLVQLRAGVEVHQEQHWQLYLAFIVAVYVNIEKEAHAIRFRRHVVTHLPLTERLFRKNIGVGDKGIWWLWSTMGSVLWQEGMWKETEELQVKVMEARSRVQGKENPDTLTIIGNLAVIYGNQGQWKEAEELEVKVMEARSRVLGEEHPDTITIMTNLAATYWKQGQ